MFSLKRIISVRLAGNGLLGLMTLSLIFHLLVLSGVIPYGIVWGGKLKDAAEMVSFEMISVLITLIMLAVVSIRRGIIGWQFKPSVVTGALWVMAAMFFLNTLGNLVSENEFEKFFFTPVTLLLAVFSLRLAIGD